MDDLQPPHAIEKGSRTDPEELRSYRSDRTAPFAIAGAIGGILIIYGWDLKSGGLVLLATLCAWIIYSRFRKWRLAKLREARRKDKDEAT
jgi:hypothetical protein